jgi:hypothetical protein
MLRSIEIASVVNCDSDDWFARWSVWRARYCLQPTRLSKAMREMVLMILASRRQAIQLRGLCQNNIIQVKRFISILFNEKSYPQTRAAFEGERNW